MNKFFLDKESKVPLYIQLKDQIKYFVSTGAIKSQERLPPIKTLAQQVGVNFLTVRKAYKDLEQEGLLTVKHGDGSFISLHKLPVPTEAPISAKQNGRFPLQVPATKLGDEIKKLVRNHRALGLRLDEIKRITEKSFAEIERNDSQPIVVFAECNQFQVREISAILEAELKFEVKSVLITELAGYLPTLTGDGRQVHIVTTGFHVNEIRQAVGDLPMRIDVLITNLNPATRRRLESVGEKGKYGFICRDQESALLYKDLLKAELGFKQIHLTSCTLNETEKVLNILNSADVVLTSPPVYEDVLKLVSNKKPVFNLFERVDPMSLKVIKDRILEKP